MRKAMHESFFFGLGYDPDLLPDGWTLEEAPDAFAMGVDPAGLRYALGNGLAVLLDGEADAPGVVELREKQ